ncbi:hypothetical protein [Streptomyces sp. RK75]|uniref:hypothetical protein n=1 Tax=Streptomyces sp. RK75 TaxID=2824895 RepID=UPI001B36BC5B|nr:hypothetical protein [Streptomyces sp. RK75]MBQ0863381.1 hypothetical protein [Streptomyces sp. RK75]
MNMPIPNPCESCTSEVTVEHLADGRILAAAWHDPNCPWLAVFGEVEVDLERTPNHPGSRIIQRAGPSLRKTEGETTNE